MVYVSQAREASYLEWVRSVMFDSAAGETSLEKLSLSGTTSLLMITIKKKQKTNLSYLAGPGLSCTMRALVPQPGFKPRPPALEAQSPGPWATRDVSQ